MLEEREVEGLVADVRVPDTATSVGRNYVHVGVRTTLSSAPDFIVIAAIADDHRWDLVGA